MCYSKEVQLITGSAISGFSLFYYIYYLVKYKTKKQKWLLPFLKNVIFGFLLIGSHQIFEFLAISNGNSLIYKIGLILSILSMFFFIRSLEIILNKKLKSKIALFIISIISIHIFLINMPFEAYSFYVRHEAGFWRSSAWMLLFIYFHICAINGRYLLKDDKSKKTIIIYLLATLDVSFILSILYTIWAYFNISVNVCTDSPSIWCTFYVVQIFILPIFLSSIPNALQIPKNKTYLTNKKTIVYFVISIIILIGLIFLLPLFKCLSLKFLFT